MPKRECPRFIISTAHFENTELEYLTVATKKSLGLSIQVSPNTEDWKIVRGNITTTDYYNAENWYYLVHLPALNTKQ